MKKRYIISPIVLIAVAVTWNVVLQSRTPVASAEIIQKYVSPQSSDPRFPIETYTVLPSYGATEADVLAHLPTTVNLGDKVTFVVDPAYGVGGIVQIQRAALITVHDGHATVQTRTFDDTVGDVLADLHRSLEGDDRATSLPSDKIQPNMEITITRVKKVKRTVTSDIPFDTVDKNDPNTDRGTDKVTQQGQDGVLTKVYEDTREDGVVVSSVLLSSSVTTPPTSKIVYHGTRIHYGSKKVYGKATWYDANTLVASNTFPKGTDVEIDNLDNGKSIEVKVDDSGGFGPSTAVDLNPSLFQKLGGNLSQGIIPNVEVRQVLNPAK